MSLSFQQIAEQIGALVTEKNAAYGSSFEVAPRIMALLYPNGIGPDQLVDALLVVRIIDKLMRIATDRDALGESPYGDITGYGILGVSMHQEKKASCATASAAPQESPALVPQKTASSAAPRVPAPTTTTVSVLTELPLMQPWKIVFAPSSVSAPATASAATEGAASPSESVGAVALRSEAEPSSLAGAAE